MIERTATSKKKAIPPQVSPSTTVYRIGGRGVEVGTWVGLGLGLGVSDWVGEGLGDPVGVRCAPEGRIKRSAA
jgi:hypothetical protein